MTMKAIENCHKLGRDYSTKMATMTEMTSTTTSIFERMGLPRSPVILAPLAGVSDHPFRRVCAGLGADLTYVEMISATAMLFKSRRTFDMMKRHESERILGVQITGRTAAEVSDAVAILDTMNFDAIDINMGCPVQKVVKVGCGSGFLKDPERVYDTVRLCRQATKKPLSAKFRLGWDHQSMNWREIASAIESAGADWMTIHGRCRSDDYGVPVNLEEMAKLKQYVKIPVIGNGNLFCRADQVFMARATGVNGFMVSRGALGNPWIFRELAARPLIDRVASLDSIDGDSGNHSGADLTVTIDDWLKVVLDHLTWQQEEYGDTGAGAVCMRKHLLWYAKGWPEVKKLREDISQLARISEARELMQRFADDCTKQGVTSRMALTHLSQEGRFQWDPKFDMDRSLDRGVGHELLDSSIQAHEAVSQL